MATPIVLLGTYANIAEVVKDAMQPEYEGRVVFRYLTRVD